ncbi:hypothetical protein IF2G_11097 [Cordyceps javanica]|nr:hypothetical protein IF2G_11097 [Cordyceps javanica]
MNQAEGILKKWKREAYTDRGQHANRGKVYSTSYSQPGLTSQNQTYTIYPLDPTHLTTFSVLAFAYPGLCKTTTAIALSTLDSKAVSSKLASTCKYFPFSRMVTLVVVIASRQM